MGVSKGEYGCTSPVIFPKLAFIVATDVEADILVKPALEKCGLLGRHDIWIIKTGKGKVNATLSTAMSLSAINSLDPKKFKECMFVNIGSCAANKFALEKATVVQIDEVFDGDCIFENTQRERVCPPPLSLSTKSSRDVNRCLTQDMLENLFIKDFNYNPYYVDSELFGIAAACSQFGVRLASLKSVSCLINESIKDTEYAYTEILGWDEKLVVMLTDYLNSNIDVVLK